MAYGLTVADIVHEKEIGMVIKKILIGVLIGIVILVVANVGTIIYFKMDGIVSFKIPRNYMVPSMRVGDKALIDTRAYKNGNLSRGDAVAYRIPENGNEIQISRVVGLPGEMIKIENGKVYINQNPVTSPSIIVAVYYFNSGEYGNTEIAVPNGAYFLLSDNSAMGRDSRYRGPVSRENIVGKVIKVQK